MFMTRRQSGDTIIEVLFSILIIGLALSIAFQTSTKALQAIQRSQERSAALKLAESQIELLRYVARGSSETEKTTFYNYVTNNGVQNNTREVCVRTPAITLAPNGSQGITLSDMGVSVPLSAPGNNRCKFNDERYLVEINATIGGQNPNEYFDYTITIKWDRLGSGGSGIQEQLDLYYRLNRNQF